MEKWSWLAVGIWSGLAAPQGGMSEMPDHNSDDDAGRNTGLEFALSWWALETGGYVSCHESGLVGGERSAKRVGGRWGTVSCLELATFPCVNGRNGMLDAWTVEWEFYLAFVFLLACVYGRKDGMGGT